MSIVNFRPQGRAGNWFLEFFACVGYAKKNGIEFSVPRYTNHPVHCPVYFTELANPKWVDGREDILINESCHEYQLLPFDKNWGENVQIVLNGYFQSFKYVYEFREDILNILNLHWELKPKTASVHIRRTDYLQLLNKHPQIGVDYYLEAMQYMKDNFGVERFEFYSDDINWCMANFGHIIYCDFSIGRCEIEDLVQISCCEHNINSSSTFSLVAAWLNRNENKQVITPKQWFVEGYPLCTKDIVPENWIKL
jgi:hypothetical protein